MWLPKRIKERSKGLPLANPATLLPPDLAPGDHLFFRLCGLADRRNSSNLENRAGERRWEATALAATTKWIATAAGTHGPCGADATISKFLYSLKVYNYEVNLKDECPTDSRS
jgi:hypothetical protein